MKKLPFHLSLLFLVALFSLSFIGTATLSPIHSHESTHIEDSRVYVCGGPYAKKFHSHSTCKGLNNCSTSIYYIESQAAAQKQGYGYCRLCWK